MTDKPEVTVTKDDRRRAEDILRKYAVPGMGLNGPLAADIALALAETRERAEAPLRELMQKRWQMGADGQAEMEVRMAEQDERIAFLEQRDREATKILAKEARGKSALKAENVQLQDALKRAELGYQDGLG